MFLCNSLSDTLTSVRWFLHSVAQAVRPAPASRMIRGFSQAFLGLSVSTLFLRLTFCTAGLSVSFCLVPTACSLRSLPLTSQFWTWSGLTVLNRLISAEIFPSRLLPQHPKCAEDLRAVTVFWDMTPCSVVAVYPSAGRTKALCCKPECCGFESRYLY
jgi:hypothetical protein